MSFHKDDILTVQPMDEDDPDALAHAGQRCRFVRTVPFTGHVVVQFSTKGPLVYFRPADLQKVDPMSPPTGATGLNSDDGGARS